MGGTIGTVLGAAAGSFIPGVGTMAGASIGGGIGGMFDSGGTSDPSMGTRTSTVGTNIPDYLMPMVTQGAQASQDLYNQGPPAYYSGQKTAPMNATQMEGMDKTLTLARTGSPLVKSAQDFANNTLTTPSGQNPYLDAILGKVEDQANAKVMSNFNASGRIGSGANAAVAGREVAGAALPYLFNQYNQDNANKFQAAGMAPSLANVNYQDAARIATVGDAYQANTQGQNNDAYAKWQYDTQAPGASLDAYLGRIYQSPGAKNTMTTQTGTYANPGFAGNVGAITAGMGAANGFGIGPALNGIAPNVAMNDAFSNYGSPNQIDWNTSVNPTFGQINWS